MADEPRKYSYRQADDGTLRFRVDFSVTEAQLAAFLAWQFDSMRLQLDDDRISKRVKRVAALLANYLHLHGVQYLSPGSLMNKSSKENGAHAAREVMRYIERHGKPQPSAEERLSRQVHGEEE